MLVGRLEDWPERLLLRLDMRSAPTDIFEDSHAGALQCNGILMVELRIFCAALQHYAVQGVDLVADEDGVMRDVIGRHRRYLFDL